MKSFNSVRLFLLALILLFLSGCAQLVYLDQAQQAFNQAASLENAAKFDSGQLLASDQAVEINRLSGQNLVAASPEIYYSLAYSRVKKALEQEDKLRQDEVLATTLTIKALCEWKLGKYGAAVKSSEQALAEMKNSEVRLPRDEAVMTALPGLIAVDLACHNFDTLAAIKLDNNINTEQKARDAYLKGKDHYEKFVGLGTAPGLSNNNMGQIGLALQKFDSAAGLVEPTHPVRLYLVMSQLAALKNWGDTHAELRNLPCTLFKENRQIGNLSTEVKDWLAQEEKWLVEEFGRYEKKRTQVLDDLARLLEGGKNDPAFKKWDSLLLSKDFGC